MVKLKKLLHKNRLYLICTVFIVLLAGFLRFYRFNERWQIHYDQARDGLVGSQAISLGRIPLNGAFTSAGPFVFGPLFYYIIIFSYLLLPKLLIAPQIIITLLNTIYAYIMLKVGEFAHSRRMGLILGLLAALSALHIERASNLTQHNLIAFFSSLTLLAFVLYLRKKRLKYLFLLGLFIGSGLSLHYQALNLFFFILIALFAYKNSIKIFIKKIFVVFLGFLIPSLPLIIWDYGRGWKNINNILDYFLIGQYRIWVSNRWLTYLGKFWPQFWAEVTGTTFVLSVLILVTTLILLLYSLWRKKLTKITVLMGLVFAGQIILNRYYRGEKLTMYLLYFQPLVIYFSGYTIDVLISIKKEVGYLFLAIIILVAAKTDLSLINNQGNLVPPLKKFISRLTSNYPHTKFRFFVYKNEEPAVGTMTSLFLSFANQVDEQKGLPLGFSITPLSLNKIDKVSGIGPDIYVYDLGQKNNNELAKEQWFNASPSYVYSDIVEWWKVKEFKSTFCLICFMKEKLGLPH